MYLFNVSSHSGDKGVCDNILLFFIILLLLVICSKQLSITFHAQTQNINNNKYPII